MADVGVRKRRRGQGEGSIYRRASDGKWVGSADLGWVGDERRRKVVYGRTQAEVITKLKRLQTEVAVGLPVEDQRITVGQLLERWLTDVLPGRVSAGTLDNYSTIARQHIVPTLGRRQLTKLTPADVQALLTERQQHRLPLAAARKGVAGETLPGGYSARTVKLIRGVLVQAIGQAERWGLVGRNVAALTDGPREPRPEGRTLTIDQARALLIAAKGERLEVAFVLMLSLGLRRGEVLGLRWSDLDLQARVLTVGQALKRVGGTVVLGEVKTPRSRRRVNLPDEVVELLLRHLQSQKRERDVPAEETQDYDLVFTTMSGQPLDPSNFRRIFDRVCAKADLSGWHPHELRHSAASIMLAQRVPLEVVSKTLGHSSIRVTADIYGHLLEPQREEAAVAMSTALWGAKT